jgi:hypothetical protein
MFFSFSVVLVISSFPGYIHLVLDFSSIKTGNSISSLFTLGQDTVGLWSWVFSIIVRSRFTRARHSAFDYIGGRSQSTFPANENLTISYCQDCATKTKLKNNFLFGKTSCVQISKKRNYRSFGNFGAGTSKTSVTSKNSVISKISIPLKFQKIFFNITCFLTCWKFLQFPFLEIWTYFGWFRVCVRMGRMRVCSMSHSYSLSPTLKIFFHWSY